MSRVVLLEVPRLRSVWSRSLVSWTVVVGALATLVACGGGGGGGTGSAVLGTLSSMTVEGVRYESPSTGGMTNAQGEFQFVPGEDISFFVGDTLLGTAPASASLSLLSLFGGLNLPTTNAEASTAVAASISFSRFINLATFLQFVDDDADVSNGIQVPAELHTVLDGVSIGFFQRWQTFRTDLRLLTMRRDGLAAGLWGGVGRPFPFPAVVLERQYDALGVAHDFYHRVESSIDSDGTPPSERLDTWTYGGPFGYFDRSERDFINGPGVDEVTVLTHSSEGAVLTRELLDGSGTRLVFGTCTYDANGNLTEEYRDSSGSGRPNSRRTYTYDAFGNRLSTSFDTNDNGSPEYELFSTYDVEGRVTDSITRNDPDEDGIDAVTYVQFDSQGRDVFRRYDDDDNPATPDDVTIRTFDSENRPLTIEIDREEDGTVDELQSWVWNGAQLMRLLTEYDTTGDGVRDSQFETAYDAMGRATVFQSDANRDGLLDSETTWTYPPAGGVINESDYDADGIIDFRSTIHAVGGVTRELDADDDGIMSTRWEYDLDNRLDQRLDDLNDDGTFDVSTKFEYDAGGRLTAELEDIDGDNVPDSTIRHEYDGVGRRTRTEVDTDGDGTPESVTSWWYQTHPTGGVVIFEDTNDDQVADKVTTTTLDRYGQLHQVLTDEGNDGGYERIETTVREPGTWAAILPHPLSPL